MENTRITAETGCQARGALRMRTDTITHTRNVLLAAFVLFAFFPVAARAADYTGERIVYEITGLGTSEFCDQGAATLDGKEVHRVTFRTRVLGFDDLETISYDPASQMPLQVERNLSFFFKREHIIESYMPQAQKLVIRKYSDATVIQEIRFQADRPISNAVLLPFSLRAVPALSKGWTTTVCMPQKFTITLAGTEQIEVPAGNFSAFHFTSEPKKFDIWISNDADRVPLKIKGAGGYGYVMSMRSRSLPKR